MVHVHLLKWRIRLVKPIPKDALQNVPLVLLNLIHAKPLLAWVVAVDELAQ